MSAKLMTLIRQREQYSRRVHEQMQMEQQGEGVPYVPETDEAMFAALSQKVFPFENHTPMTRGLLNMDYGAETVGTIEAAFASIPADDPVKELVDEKLALIEGDGLDFADAGTQMLITVCEKRGFCTADQATRLRSVGKRMVSVLDQNGLGDVTLEALSASRSTERRRTAVKEAVCAAYNSSIPEAEEGTLTPEAWAERSAAVLAAFNSE